MKILNLKISETHYEKFRLEAIKHHKSLEQVLRDRVFATPFEEDIEQAYSNWLEEKITQLIEGE